MAETGTPSIEQRDSFIVIGMQYEGPMDNHEGLSALWENYSQRAQEIEPKDSETTGFGVFTVSPEQAGKDEMNYMACAPVTEATPVPEGMVKLDVPGGLYAFYTHKGYLSELQNSHLILMRWISESGYETDQRPGYELYDQRFNPSSPDCEIDLFVAVRDKQ